VRTSLKLIKTSTFRLAALYLSVFALSVGLILAYVYWNTVVLLERQSDETIRAEVSSLGEQYTQGGVGQLVDTIKSRSEHASGNIYLLTNYFGRRIAGNLDAMPVKAVKGRGWIEFPYAVETVDGVERHQARAFHTPLDLGFTLLVGRDVQERREFAELIGRTLFWALGIAVVFGLGGGILMSRNFLRRVDSISQTSRTIMAGDLSGRMPVSGTGDELDRLAGNLNEMLDQIERLMVGMKEISSNVAHDLKTPLTRLRARVEDALRQKDDAVHKAALEETLEEADQLLRTFNALLSIARTEAGQAREGLTGMEAGGLVEEIAELFEPLVEEEGGTLAARAESGLAIRGDRQLLAQALTNLVDNALKYAATDERALRIELSAQRRGDTVVIAVADNGPGVPEGERERVVERFVRLDRGRSKPGNGLGLSLVSAVTSLHGGTLELKDNEPGLRAELVLPSVGDDG